MLERGPFPKDATTKALLANAFFWSRVYPGFERDSQISEKEIDRALAAYDKASRSSIRVTTPFEDEPEFELRFLSVPLYLPGNFLWEVELYDNSEDAGASFYLHAPGAKRLELGVYDPHSRFAFCLSWEEALSLVAAAARERRNDASGATRVALLLLWTTVALRSGDPLAAIRGRIEACWRASGAVSARTAAALAAAIQPRRTKAPRAKKIAPVFEACLVAVGAGGSASSQVRAPAKRR